MKSQRITKIISVLLIITLLCPMLLGATTVNANQDTSLYAEESHVSEVESQAHESDLSSEELKNAVLDQADIPYFVPEKLVAEYDHVKRLYDQEEDLNTVIFQNRNGTKTMYYYPTPIKYYNADGVQCDYDMTIREISKGAKKEYQVKNGDYEIRFSEENKVTINKDGYLISLSALELNKTANTTASLRGNTSIVKLDNTSYNTNIITEKKSSLITYSSLTDQSYISEYQPDASGVTINVTVSAETHKIAYLLYLNNLVPVKTENELLLYNEVNENVASIQFSEFYVDSIDNSDFANIAIAPIGDGKYLLEVENNASLLGTSGNSGQVRAQASVTISGTSGIEDTTLYGGLPYNNTGALGSLYVGDYTARFGGSQGVSRVLMKFPGLLSNSTYKVLNPTQIISCDLFMKDVMCEGEITPISAYMFFDDWTESDARVSNLDWNAYSYILETIPISYNHGESSSNWYNFDITAAAKRWKQISDPNECSGIILKAENETNACRTFGATERPDSNPYVVLNYNPDDTSHVQGVTTGEIYFIKNNNSGKHIYVDSTSLGSRIRQRDLGGEASQRMRIVRQSNGFYKIYFQNCDYILGLNSSNYVALIHPDATVDGAYWKINRIADGQYHIINKTNIYNDSPMYLSVTNNSTMNLTYLCIDTTIQTSSVWSLEEAWTPTVESTITSGSTYYIQNSNSSKYMASPTSATGNITQATFDGSTRQQIKLTYQGNGYYKLSPANLSSYIFYYNTSTKKVELTGSGTTSDNCYWIVKRNADGSYSFINKVNAYTDQIFLGVYGNSKNSGAYAYKMKGSNASTKWLLSKTPSTTDTWVPTSTLAKIVHAVGFSYDASEDIIYARQDGWQSKVGYCDAYDELQPIIFNIDCESIEFTYGGNDWRFEFWKGQYGIETGGEIGIYKRSSGERDWKDVLGRFYNCSTDQQYRMRFYMYHNGSQLFYRPYAETWWQTGFKWGVLTEDPTTELRMSCYIDFANDTGLKNAFVSAMNTAGYSVSTSSSSSVVSWSFATPKTEQPALSWFSKSVVNNANIVLVDAYNYYKSYCGITSNNPNNMTVPTNATAKDYYDAVVGFYETYKTKYWQMIMDFLSE